MEKTGYFPKCMRTSKATFIPGRTIFSLETAAKITEGILSEEFTVCTLDDYEVNGDPGGFAHRKDRGVLSCIGATLSCIEAAPRIDNVACAMSVMDLKKAFNSAKRSTIVRESQRIAGCGRLMHTRWVDRTYTFEGETRGLNYNKGTDAGAHLAVWGFDRWINTDISSLKISRVIPDDPVILTTCNYSDDRNPNSNGTNITNGRYQSEVLDGMFQWSKDEQASFHLSGKKGPGTLVFQQKILKDG